MRHAQEVNDDMWRQGKNGMRRGVRTSTHIGLVGALTASAIVAVPIIVATSAAADASGACPTFTGSTTTEYTTAGDFTFNVPATASLVCVEAVGGRGGSGSLTGTPGLAGFAGGAFPVTASSTLAVQVAGNASGSTGGANGGGRGNTAANFVGGGGGGASQVKSGTTPWLVAAGGAGGGQFAGGSGGNQTPVAVSGLGTIAPGSGGLSSASQGGTVGAAGTSAKGGDGGKGTKLGDWGGGGGGGGNGGGGGGGGGSLASPATNPAGGVGGTAAAGGSGTTAAGAGGPGGGMYSAGTVGAGANGTGNQVSAGGAGYGGGGGGGAGRSSGGGGSSFVKNTAVSSSVSFASAAADSTPYVNITTYTLYSDLASYDFGDQAVPSTTTQAFTITNATASSTTIGTVSIGGAGASQFDLSGGSDTCSNQTLASGSTCTVSASFVPTAAGEHAGELQVPSGAGNIAIPLTGTGLGPNASPSPSDFDFGPNNVGTTTPETFTITNSGTEALSVSSVVLTGSDAGEFSLGADTCTGMPVAADAQCTIVANFVPTATGAKSASVSITSDDPASPTNIPVTGIGTNPGFAASPDAKDYGSANTGTTTTQTFTITNNGPDPLAISAIALTGDDPGQFALPGGAADTCTGQTLAARATCTVDANFVPTTTGSKSADLAFTDDGGNHTIALSGTGTAPGFSASPASKDYGSANTGTNTPQTFTITNNGDGPLTISTVMLTGDDTDQFSITTGVTNTCAGQTIAASATCTVEANFAPTTTGAAAAELAFTDNAGNHTIALSGTGTEPGFSASPASKDYGSASTGTTTTQTFTITNNGDGPLTINAVGITGTNANQFTLTGGASDTCTGQTIAASAACTVEANFVPTVTGAKSASISFTDNAGNNTITLTGTGTAPGFSASPASKDYGYANTGTTTAQTFTITNSGDAPLTISTVTLTGDDSDQFSITTGVTNTCAGQTVAASTTCTVEANFVPTTTGAASANLAFTDNAGNHTIALSGTGTAPGFSASPSSKDYGSANTGTTNAQTFTITNNGTGPLTISAVTLTGDNTDQFSITTGVTNTCASQTIAASATCTVEANFVPTTTGAASANLAFTDNAGNHTIALSGTGTAPGFSADPASRDFSSANTGTTTAAQVFTITNDGDGPLTISAVGLTGANANQFSLTGGAADTCTGEIIAATATCEIEANFAPTTTGAKSATVSFTDNAGNHTIALSGTGTAPGFSADPASKDYSNTNIGTTATAQTFTITNDGDGPLTISAVTLTGANANQFT
ncbi:MAG: choice-of-anchor D domain-containing protein, partial [Candidatus Nanopelagicales bacterium]